MKKYILLLCLIVFVLPQLVLADVKLNALFSDRMVVQRKTEIPVRGWVANISGKNTIVINDVFSGEVWSHEVSNPIHLRYAWSSNLDGANIYNKEELPAAVFKTK